MEGSKYKIYNLRNIMLNRKSRERKERNNSMILFKTCKKILWVVYGYNFFCKSIETCKGMVNSQSTLRMITSGGREIPSRKGKNIIVFLKLSKEYLDVSFFHSYFFFLTALWGFFSLSSQPGPSAVRTWRPNHCQGIPWMFLILSCKLAVFVIYFIITKKLNTRYIILRRT